MYKSTVFSLSLLGALIAGCDGSTQSTQELVDVGCRFSEKTEVSKWGEETKSLELDCSGKDEADFKTIEAQYSHTDAQFLMKGETLVASLTKRIAALDRYRLSPASDDHANLAQSVRYKMETKVNEINNEQVRVRKILLERLTTVEKSRLEALQSMEEFEAARKELQDEGLALVMEKGKVALELSPRLSSEKSVSLLSKAEKALEKHLAISGKNAQGLAFVLMAPDMKFSVNEQSSTQQIAQAYEAGYRIKAEDQKKAVNEMGQMLFELKQRSQGMQWTMPNAMSYSYYSVARFELGSRGLLPLTIELSDKSKLTVANAEAFAQLKGSDLPLVKKQIQNLLRTARKLEAAESAPETLMLKEWLEKAELKRLIEFYSEIEKNWDKITDVASLRTAHAVNLPRLKKALEAELEKRKSSPSEENLSIIRRSTYAGPASALAKLSVDWARLGFEKELGSATETRDAYLGSDERFAELKLLEEGDSEVLDRQFKMQTFKSIEPESFNDSKMRELIKDLKKAIEAYEAEDDESPGPTQAIAIKGLILKNQI